MQARGPLGTRDSGMSELGGRERSHQKREVPYPTSRRWIELWVVSWRARSLACMQQGSVLAQDSSFGISS